MNWMHICTNYLLMSAALAAVYRRTILIAGSRLRVTATEDPAGTGTANRSHFGSLDARALGAASAMVAGHCCV